MNRVNDIPALPPRRVMILGHSFVQNLKMHEKREKIAANCSFTASEHQAIYQHQFSGLGKMHRIFTIGDLCETGVIEALTPYDGMVRMLVIIIGGNDVASSAFTTRKQVDNLVNFMMSAKGKLAEQVCVVQLPYRYRFTDKNPQFRVESSGRSLQDSIQLYADRIDIFNARLFAALEKKPNLYVVPIKGLHENQSQWMYDGIHYTFEAERKLQNSIKRKVVGWSRDYDREMGFYQDRTPAELQEHYEFEEQAYKEDHTDFGAEFERVGLPSESDFESESDDDECVGAVGGQMRSVVLIPDRKVTVPCCEDVQRDFSPEFTNDFELDLPLDLMETEPEFSLENVQVEGVVVAPVDHKPAHYYDDLQEDFEMEDYYFESYSLDDC